MASCPLFFAHSRNTVSISRRRTKAATLLGLYRSLPLSSSSSSSSFLLLFVRVLSVQTWCRFQVKDGEGQGGGGHGGGRSRGRRGNRGVACFRALSHWHQEHLWRPKTDKPLICTTRQKRVSKPWSRRVSLRSSSALDGLRYSACLGRRRVPISWGRAICGLATFYPAGIGSKTAAGRPRQK